MAEPSFSSPDFWIGDRLVRPHLNRIEGPDGAVQVERKVMEVLALLAGRQGEVVSKEELIQKVWEGRFVSDDVVWRSVGELRRALGDGAIQTIPKRGYRLAALTPRPPLPEGEGEKDKEKTAPILIPRRLLGPALLLGFALIAAIFVLGHARRERNAAVFAAPPARTATLPSDPKARDAYLKGMHFLQRGMPDDVRKSVEAFEEAVALDPGSAVAHAGLADAVHLLTVFGALPPRDAYPRAEAAARKALELDGSLADTHATLGSILFRFHRDWPAAEREFRRALELDPASATAHHDYAWFLVSMKRFDEAVSEMQAAQAIDPLSPRANADTGWVYYRARRYPEAIHQMERTLELEPRFLPARHCLERALAHEGRLAEALDHARESARQEGMSAEELADLPLDPAAALRRIGEWRLGRLRSPYALAAQHAELGDRDRAFAELERAFAGRDPSLVAVNVDPAFDKVRSDPRFRELVDRLGLPRE